MGLFGGNDSKEARRQEAKAFVPQVVKNARFDNETERLQQKYHRSEADIQRLRRLGGG